MSDGNFQIIGIDCAADPKNMGVAYAKMAGTRCIVEHVRFGKGGQPSRSCRLRELADEVVERIRQAHTPTLLALDAPLGWPSTMGRSLPTHLAGERLPDDPDAGLLFSRFTDRFVAQKTGKTPLEVGANLIARVSHTALRLLDRVRSSDGVSDFPLLLSRDDVMPRGVNLIEVYPALVQPFFLSSEEKPGTTTYWGELSGDLKKLKKDEDGDWCERLRQVGERLTEGELVFQLTDVVADAMKTRNNRDHGLDAILCAWTGFRFLLEGCVEPPVDHTGSTGGLRSDDALGCCGTTRWCASTCLARSPRLMRAQDPYRRLRQRPRWGSRRRGGSPSRTGPLARQGGDPLALRTRRDVPDFATAAAKVIDIQAGAWKNAGKSRAQWESSLAAYGRTLDGELRMPPEDSPPSRAGGWTTRFELDAASAAPLAA